MSPILGRDPRPGAHEFWRDFEEQIQSARHFLAAGAVAFGLLSDSWSGLGFDSKAYSHNPGSGLLRIGLQGAAFGSLFGIPTHELEAALHAGFGHSVEFTAQGFVQDIIDHIKKTTDWQTLKRIAEAVLGPYSLATGILAGVVESLGKDAASLLGLAKIVVLAGLYERIKRPVMLSFSDPLTLTLALAVRRFPRLYREAENADKLLRETLKELKEIALHPIKFIEIVGKSAWKGVQKDWDDLKYYAMNRTIMNDFQAGRIMGRALYQVIMMILLVISVAGVAAKLAARFPWLMRLARIISRGGKLEELEDLEQGVRGARGADDAAAARKGSSSQLDEPKPSVDRRAVADWRNSFPKRQAVGQGPAHDFQVKTCGPTETQVSGGGQQVWVDGIDDSTGSLQEAKYVGNPEKSPFVGDSSIDPEIRRFIQSKTADEFQRYAAVINDPATPVSNLEVITNDSRAVSYFQSLLDKFSIPGTVTVIK